MGAPSGTTWGNIITGSKSTRQGRIGIYVSCSNSDTARTVTVQVWFWTKYSVSDSSNTFYADWNTTNATSSQGSRNVSTSVSSGGGWDASNQVHLGTWSNTYTRGTSSATKYFAAKITGIDNLGSGNVSSHYVSFTIPALPSYTVSYNANGGSSKPSDQTKWYGIALTLANAISRTGHSFRGWGTSASDTTVDYSAGGRYTNNSSITLYAIWKADTYQVSYNANGGSGAPSTQTKTYGTTLTLSKTVPTRQYYNFLGWATTANAISATYKAGGSYTLNSAVTLYAVWELAYVKPRITNAFVTRCRVNTISDGNDATTNEIVLADDGTSALVSFDWATDFDVTKIAIMWKKSIEESWTHGITIDASGTSGSVKQTIGYDDPTHYSALSIENTYDISILVTDTESSRIMLSLSAMLFPIDVYKKGTGIAFGKPAELANIADFGWPIRHGAGFNYPTLEIGSDLNAEKYRIPNKYIMINAQTSDYKCGDNSIPITSGTGMLTIESFGPEGQTKQTIEACHKTNQLRYERYYYEGDWGDWCEAGGYKSVISVAPNSSVTLGVVNTYTHLPMNKTIASKGGGLRVSDGYVQIGEGIQRVKINAQIKVTPTSVNGNRHIRICKDSGGNIGYLGWHHKYLIAGQEDILVFTPIEASVKKGDLIYVIFYTPSASDSNYNGSSDTNGNQTYLTVESI